MCHAFVLNFSQASCWVQGTGERSRFEVVQFGPSSSSKNAFASWCRRETGKPAASPRQSSTSTCGLTPRSTTKRWLTYPYTTHAVFTTDVPAGSISYSRLHFSVCSLGPVPLPGIKPIMSPCQIYVQIGFQLAVMETGVRLCSHLLGVCG